MKGVYFIWALLPLALIAIAIRAAVRRTVNAAGREYPGEYLKQAIYCSIALAIAIPIYEYWFDDLVAYFGYEDTDLRVIGWLIYPLVLFVGASVQNYFFKKREDELDQERKKRRQDWMFRKMGQ